MISVAPSMLACDFTRMGEEAERMKKAGADCLHLDVMDGVFVPNFSFGNPVIASLRRVSDLPFDVHLMIVEPEKYIDKFIEAGADWVTIHVEATHDPALALETVRMNGKRAGISLKPKTPIEAILPYLHLCDYVLVMTVEPGFGGQSLIPETLDKVAALRRVLDEKYPNIAIEVDGGIGPKNAGDAVRAGAEILVAGSSVFGASDPAAAIEALRNAE